MKNLMDRIMNKNSELPQAKETPVRNNLTPICDFSRGVLNARFSARIQHLLRGHI